MELPRTPSFRLDGKRALVAGASSGIGLGPGRRAGRGTAPQVTLRRAREGATGRGAAIRAGFSAEAFALDVADDCGRGRSAQKGRSTWW